MDRLTKLLNQFAHTRRHRYLQERRPAQTNCGRGVGFLYITSSAVREQLPTGNNLKKTGSASVAATIITE
jgi:hypothetical protein